MSRGLIVGATLERGSMIFQTWVSLSGRLGIESAVWTRVHFL